MISAALIVRNEASEIEACLTTLREVDEIVVCDTGSEDDTVARIAKWAARHNKALHVDCHFLWCDDFSAARNYAASLCSGDWILHVDADMRLAAGGVPTLRKALATAKGHTMALTQESMKGGWRNRRVLCHRPGVKWVGAIHEFLERDDGETARTTVYYGWSDSHHKDPDRNLRILQRGLEREPEDARLAYYLGQERWDRGQLEEAFDAFSRCLENCSFRSERADARLYQAKIRWRQSRGEEARQHCLESLLLVPDCREALLLMAEMSWDQEAAVWRTFAEVAQNRNVLFERA